MSSHTAALETTLPPLAQWVVSLALALGWEGLLWLQVIRNILEYRWKLKRRFHEAGGAQGGGGGASGPVLGPRIGRIMLPFLSCLLFSFLLSCLPELLQSQRDQLQGEMRGML